MLNSELHIKENKIKIGSHQLNYAEFGIGAPMIFLTNGGGFWQSWIQQIKHFSQSYKVYAFDWPGCGNSDIFDKMPELDFFLSILTTFIDHFNLKNIIIVGNCIGASIALKYNILNPGNVKKLILFNICPGDRIFPNKITRRFIKSLNYFTFFKPIISELIRLSIIYTPLKQHFPAMLFGKNTNRDSELYKSLEIKVKQKIQSLSRIDLMASLHSYNCDKIVKDYTIPAHILFWGSENQVTSLEKQGIYHKSLLNPMNFYTIEFGGHLCMYEFPEEVNFLIDKYLAFSIYRDKQFLNGDAQ